MNRERISKLIGYGLVLALAAVASPTVAQTAGTWSLGVGAGWVIPQADNGKIAGGAVQTDVGNDIKPTFTVEYFILDNVGIQLLGAIPFTQTVALHGGGFNGHVGSVQHLPPALYLQYHFSELLGLLSPALQRITPFAGVGVEHSFIYNENIDDSLKPNEFAVSGSTSYTFHGGIDYALNKHSAIRFDIYYINIDSDVELNGAGLGTTHIDPLVWNLGFVWNF